VFHLAQSDDEGYLSPVLNDLDPEPIKTLPMFPDRDYYCYFVRHPGSDLPLEIVKRLRDNADRAKKDLGEWRALKATLEAVGKNSKKELVLRVAEDPSWFVPQGHEIYGRWVLFREMPGTGSPKVRKGKDAIQCPPLREQVRKLQYHLGAMRYPIGTADHPYIPDPAKEGVFEGVTWNAVVALQKDAREGKALKLNSATTRTPLWTPGSYEPTPEASNTELQARESAAYVAQGAEEHSEVKADLPYETVVDKPTGAAIQKRLDGGWRKPGKVYVCLGIEKSPTKKDPSTVRYQDDYWMAQDAVQILERFSTALKLLGLKIGVRCSCCYRGVETQVSSAGVGCIRLSIHKTGFAFDMSCSAFVGWASKGTLAEYLEKSYPLFFEKDESVKDKWFWIVYALVKESDIVPEPQRPEEFQKIVGKYAKTIRSWKYNRELPNGGEAVELTAPEGTTFLNFTDLAKQFGLHRIPAHANKSDKQGWILKPKMQIRLSTPDDFAQVVTRISANLDVRGHTTDELSVNGAKYTLAQFQEKEPLLAQWCKDSWPKATPNVEIDPTSKEGEKLLGSLQRGKAYQGQKFLLFKEGGKAEGEELTIEGKKTSFPLKEPFALRPVTEPISFKPGDTVDLPALSGTPEHMEWWHFQHNASIEGVEWGDLLGPLGWSEEGLLGKKGPDDPGIYGLYGLGYTSMDLHPAEEARKHEEEKRRQEEEKRRKKDEEKRRKAEEKAMKVKAKR